MRWDFFHKPERGNGDAENYAKSLAAPAYHYQFEIDTEDLAEALNYAYENGLPRGSARLGCVEVQNDLGIYSREDGKRVDVSTPRRAAKVNFQPWE